MSKIAEKNRIDEAQEEEISWRYTSFTPETGKKDWR